MLFDLRGKRKRFIQVVYATLALLFAVSFVGFGVGSDAAGGIFDALGLGGDDGGGNPQFEQQIDQAESQLAQDPENVKALEALVRVHYSAGNDALEIDEETGTLNVTPEAEQEFRASAEAWERYLEATKKPDEGVASIALQSFGALIQSSSDLAELQSTAEEAVTAARVVAENSPTGPVLGQLAEYLYFAGEVEEGDEVRDQALAKADESQRRQLEQRLDSVRKEIVRLEKQQEKLPEGGAAGEPFQNPLDDLGSGAGAPAAPLP